MDEESRTQEPGAEVTPVQPERGRLAESWREVGEQLQELAGRLAAAFRTSWSEERGSEHEETVRNLRDDLRAAADRLDRVMRRVAEQTEPHREATARATREASERSLAEARSAAVAALRSLNRQLDLLASRLERERAESDAGPAHTATKDLAEPSELQEEPPRS